MTRNSAAFERLMGQVFDDYQEGLREKIGSTEYDRRRNDFIFHMADWENDGRAFIGMLDHPETQDVETASTFVIGFLYHVVPHLSAASRLLLNQKVPDPFAESDEVRTPSNATDA